MLSQHLAQYTALQRAVGYKFRTPYTLLGSFVAYAEDHGDAFIRIDRVIDWAAQASSPAQRRTRLLTVRRFALTLRAEDPRHEVPGADALGPRLSKRRIPYIYKRDEIDGLIQAARKLEPAGSIRPLTYATLFGLLAATGMRISEALALQLDDLTEDGLIIRQTKFRKSRLLPLHATARRALAAYLAVRMKIVGSEPAFFIARSGRALGYSTVIAVFLQIVRLIGLRSAPGNPGPRLHDLRHNSGSRIIPSRLPRTVDLR